MVVAVLACAVGLAVVAWTLLRDDLLPAPAPRSAPDWGPLPEPADLLRLEFPKSVPGYDPASVDAHLDALVVAYRDLLAEAPPEVVARARRRAAARRGLPLDEPAPSAPQQAGSTADGDDGGADGAPAPSTCGVDALGDTAEALRAEAVLATLRQDGERR
ncbi:MAG TPA: DivIVA domain-containing protein [Egibacteraceae bacterium]